MLTQRALFAYLFIIIILTIVFAIINTQEGAQTWLDKVAPQEKALYTLELEVPISEEDINMTKAGLFYKQREKYCEAIASEKERLLCYKRTMPWWSKIYREKELQVH